jgi:hypothetical protein
MLRACETIIHCNFFTLPRRKPGRIVPRHEPILAGKALLLRFPQKFRAAEVWVPAFPTELVRGLKAHGKARRKVADCVFKGDFFTCAQGEGPFSMA